MARVGTNSRCPARYTHIWGFCQRAAQNLCIYNSPRSAWSANDDVGLVLWQLIDLGIVFVHSSSSAISPQQRRVLDHQQHCSLLSTQYLLRCRWCVVSYGAGVESIIRKDKYACRTSTGPGVLTVLGSLGWVSTECDSLEALFLTYFYPNEHLFLSRVLEKAP